MNRDADLYSRHRGLQKHDTKEFLCWVVSKMDWSRMSEDVVMDIGCGPGNSTLNQLLPTIPEVGKIVAVDVLPSMIEYAKSNNAHPKIEYCVANIEDRSSLENWFGRISKVISAFVYHWLDHQKEGFQNTYQLLKPGGEAAILFVVRDAYWSCFGEIAEMPKWKTYLKGVDQHVPASHFSKNWSFAYGDMMREIGFDVTIFDEEKRQFTYENDEDCKESIASICAMTNYIPEEMKDEFVDVLFDGFLKYNSRNSDGKPTMLYTTLTVLLRKPEKR